MIIGREISSVKERHFFLKEDYFMFLSPLRDKIKRLAKLKPVPQYTKQSFTFLLDTREMTELWFIYAEEDMKVQSSEFARVETGRCCVRYQEGLL